ncbi:phosphate starvation-inducible PhoH-like protein [Bosea sp. OAE752]|jgi:phosphate starvation-inducible PhoH-like protein|uniref:PhoH-like protein n=1 Tax=Bosea spartocytisi TaxID=2773451 RepID=A0A927E839_9HYPH|nr:MULTISPECIES: PhoH family protein [Bosea]MBD3845520.1 PhoH family protein [Bosea spartocytisi]MCT4472691.1 PhoH family protein [Bosea spartocytisi]
MTPKPDRTPRREIAPARGESLAREGLPATEVTLSFEDNRLASLVFGQYDQNLAHLERRLGVVVNPNGNHVTAKGPRETAEQAVRVLKTLYARAKAGAAVTLGDVDGAIEESNVQRSLFPTADTGKASFDAIVTRKRGPVRARNAAQDAYLRQLKRHELVLAEGPAGTGKTWLAVGHAVSLIEQGVVERMILSRPAVEAGERLGFLPGDMREKVDPYLRPIYDALNDFMEARHVERGLQTGMIEIAPLAFMRGRTLTNAVVLLDEAQNATSMQMKMFLTRLGEGSRMIITGDPSQIDLPPGQRSGLVEAAKLLKDVEGIGYARFEEGDVVRHDLVRRIVMAYEASARREREEREEAMRNSAAAPEAHREGDSEGLKRMLARERPR